MRKTLGLAAIIGILISGCKKDASNELIGTWSLYSHDVVLGTQHSETLTAAQYPCMADVKFIFNTDGTYFSPKYLCDFNTNGQEVNFENDNDQTNKWSLKGNTVYVTLLDNLQHQPFTDTLVLTGNQLIGKYHEQNFVVTEVWIKK